MKIITNVMLSRVMSDSSHDGEDLRDGLHYFLMSNSGLTHSRSSGLTATCNLECNTFTVE